MSVKTSAPGKLMLFGEHAVVYKRPCLVTAVDLRVHVLMDHNVNNEIVIETPRLKELGQKYILPAQKVVELSEYSKETAFVTAAIQKFFLQYKFCSGIILNTSGPQNSFGLGSSSAVTVATIAALSQLFQINISKRQLFDLAYSAVLAVQKEGSGFDVASATYGGTLFYKTPGEIIEEIKVVDLPIIIGYSGKKVSTTNLIDKVRELRFKRQNLIDGIFDVMNNIVWQAKEEMMNSNWEAIGELMNINQGLLESLSVSTLSLAQPIYAARESGAYGAKLSGAGGGDCMFAIINNQRRKKISDAINASGAQVVEISSNVEGVRVE